MRLSVLDQAPVTKGNNSADALLKAEELAILADELDIIACGWRSITVCLHM